MYRVTCSGQWPIRGPPGAVTWFSCDHGSVVPFFFQRKKIFGHGHETHCRFVQQHKTQPGNASLRPAKGENNLDNWASGLSGLLIDRKKNDFPMNNFTEESCLCNFWLESWGYHTWCRYYWEVYRSLPRIEPASKPHREFSGGEPNLTGWHLMTYNRVTLKFIKD